MLIPYNILMSYFIYLGHQLAHQCYSPFPTAWICSSYSLNCQTNDFYDAL